MTTAMKTAITKEQAMTADYFHYTGRHECIRTVGPKGGVTVNITAVRRNGRTQTWKTRPQEFRVPIKYGLYEYSEITHENAGDFHLASECPLNSSDDQND